MIYRIQFFLSLKTKCLAIQIRTEIFSMVFQFLLQLYIIGWFNVEKQNLPTTQRCSIKGIFPLNRGLCKLKQRSNVFTIAHSRVQYIADA